MQFEQQIHYTYTHLTIAVVAETAASPGKGRVWQQAGVWGRRGPGQLLRHLQLLLEWATTSGRQWPCDRPPYVTAAVLCCRRFCCLSDVVLVLSRAVPCRAAEDCRVKPRRCPSALPFFSPVVHVRVRAYVRVKNPGLCVRSWTVPMERRGASPGRGGRSIRDSGNVGWHRQERGVARYHPSL